MPGSSDVPVDAAALGGTVDRTGLLGAVLARSHHAEPGDMVRVIAEEAARHGLHDLVLHLIDYEQRSLVPLSNHGARAEPADIDTTLVGRAYRLIQTLDVGDDSSHRLLIPVLDGTERVGVMEVTVTSLDEELVAAAHNLATLAAELLVTKDLFGDAFSVARRTRAMTLAAEMQWNLLPPLTFLSPRVAISGMIQPCYEVGGDSFDYAVNEDTVHFAIFDAMGHGLDAGLMASLAVGAYRNSRRNGRSLTESFASIDVAIAEQFGTERFVTGLLVELDLLNGTLRWLCAGHPSPLLLRSGRSIDRLESSPLLPFGLGDEVAGVVEESLEPGDRLLLYTDGVVEARSADGRFFGLDGLTDLVIRQSAAGLPVPETLRVLGHAILDHHDGELRDDATTLFVEWSGATEA
jgi:serine phosphatase RsbU (regulator of sigma subunit)